MRYTVHGTSFSFTHFKWIGYSNRNVRERVFLARWLCYTFSTNDDINSRVLNLKRQKNIYQCNNLITKEENDILWFPIGATVMLLRNYRNLRGM